jgi:hypothetical protein
VAKSFKPKSIPTVVDSLIDFLIDFGISDLISIEAKNLPVGVLEIVTVLISPVNFL